MTDKDIDEKLKKMEEQLDVITSSLAPRTPERSDPRFLSAANPESQFASAGRSDEIDLRELVSILWQGKWWIIGVTFLFAVAGVVYALNLPNMYKSEGIYAPAQKDNSGGRMASHLGGLASLAGVRLGGDDGNDIDQAMLLITSWPFLEGLIQREELAPLVLAVQGWDKSTGALIWNHDIYDIEKKQWLNNDIEKPVVPTSYEIYRGLNKMLTAKVNAKTGMVTISVVHYSPVVAERWVRLLVNTLNAYFQKRDIVDAERNISYLENKISETGITKMQAVFYSMVESQMKTLMLAEVGEEYLIREVVAPKVSELKSSPARGILVCIFVLFGGFFAVSFVLLHSLFWRR